MNNDGVVVGSGTICPSLAKKAFRWTEDTGLVVLPLPFPESIAYDINAAGTIVGRGWPQGGGQPSVGWILRDGRVEIIPKPPGGDTIANGVLEDDTVFGEQHLAHEPWLQGFLWRDGKFLPLPPALAAKSFVFRGRSRGFNGHPGYIVGKVDLPPIDGWAQWEAIRYDIVTGEVTSVALPAPYFRGDGVAATPDGRVFGKCQMPEDSPELSAPPNRAIESGSPAAIVVDPILPNTAVRFNDVNDLGQATGDSFCQFGPCYCDGVPCSGPWSQRAILWTKGELVDLDVELADIPGGPSGYRGSWAINDRGVIAMDGVALTNMWIAKPIRPPGDVDLDCKVDMDDLMHVLENWGPRSESMVYRADLDWNGVIDGWDLAEVLGGWTAR